MTVLVHQEGWGDQLSEVWGKERSHAEKEEAGAEMADRLEGLELAFQQQLVVFAWKMMQKEARR
jgi:hypothetical protein